MRIALASLDQRWEDKPANLELCAAAARSAAAAGAALVVFPEMTLTGFTMRATEAAESPEDSPTVGAFGDLARAERIAIGFGVVLAGARRPRNCFVVVGSDGVEVARYAKLHPFTYAGEASAYEAGDSLAAARVGGVAFGLAVCYDLRFPEPYALLAERCTVLVTIANWPARREDHWHALLRARAIECQAYAAGVNRTGTDGNGVAYSRSTVLYDPRGERVPADVVSGDVELFTIDPARVAAYRQEFPVLPDRRPELYARLASKARSPSSSGEARSAPGDSR
jgi:predicted amidohydrolase